MNKFAALALLPILAVGIAQARDTAHGHADEATIAAQNAALDKNTEGKGFGPQSPRDLAVRRGSNLRAFSTAPAYTQMNLCNIHFHKNAEHKGGEFTTYAGAGDGHGVDASSKLSQVSR